MKKTIISTIMLAAVMFAFAQQNITTKVASSEPLKVDRAKQQTEILTQTLSLTPEQKEKVNAVCLEFFAAREQFISLKETNRSEFTAKMKSLEQTAEAKMIALLSKDQVKKYEEYRKTK